MPKIPLPTIGEILKEEFIEPYKISQNALAEAINVPAGRISEIINNKRAVTADTDLRLTKFFGLTDGYFLRLQENLDIRRTKAEIGEEINNIIPIHIKSIRKNSSMVQEA